MYNLLVFLKKYSAVLLFLLLEIVCILLILNSLPYHNRKLVSMSNSITGGVHTKMSDIGGYFNLKKENELLTQHNAFLMNKLEKYDFNGDSTFTDQTFTYMPANVVSNSLYEMNNYIMINKGRIDGVEVDMGVISGNGVVGKVVNVSNHYASVMSLLNTYSVTSARFVDNQNIASVVWKNDGCDYGTVIDIPAHVDIKKGDSLVTSGFSNTLPAGISIGVIEESIPEERDDFKSARLKFSTNFSTLQHVYVVKNNFKSEIDSLCLTPR